MISKKRHDLRELSSSLPNLFAMKNWPLLWQTYTLVRQWEAIVGKNIAKKSEPAYIQNDTLWVYVESSVLMQHMQAQKINLLAQIDKILPEAGIKEIRWEMKPSSPVGKSTARKHGTRYSPAPGDQEAFESMAATVEDKQCRAALTKLWRTFNQQQQIDGKGEDTQPE